MAAILSCRYHLSGRFLVFGLTFFLFVGISQRARSNETEMLLRRFTEEGPKAWERYRSLAIALQGRISIIHKKGDIETFRGAYITKEKPGNRLDEQDSYDAESKKTERVVYGMNPDYFFTLKRQSADAAWVLTNLISRNAGNMEELPNPYRWRFATPPQAVLLAIGNSDIDKIVKQTTFRAIRASRVNRDGDDLIQIEFDNPHPLLTEPFEPIQSGTVLLDPARSWCVRGYDVRTLYGDSKGSERSEVLRIRDSNTKASPLPVRMTSTLIAKVTEKNAEREVIASRSADWDYDELHIPVDSEFRLPAYGLPEPIRHKQPSKWYLWAFGAALAFCLLGFILRRFVKAQGTKAPSPLTLE